MIVFPLIRSVGLKAATASSRAATLPMLEEQAVADHAAHGDDDVALRCDSGGNGDDDAGVAPARGCGGGAVERDGARTL